MYHSLAKRTDCTELQTLRRFDTARLQHAEREEGKGGGRNGVDLSTRRETRREKDSGTGGGQWPRETIAIHTPET